MEQYDQYNATAVKYAAALHDFRRQHQRAQPGKRSRDDVFPAHDRTGLGVALEYERMGNRPVSADLEARADALGLRFEHIGITLGTIIHGIDLTNALTTEQVAVLRATLLERKVIFFRNQPLTEDQHVSFGRYFGELDAFPFGKPGGNPFVLEIVHDDQHPGIENGWHTDVTWMECPSLGSIAQCIETSPIGGDTLFADSHAAYLGLPERLREQIESVHGINDYRIFLAGRGGPSVPEELTKRIKADIPFGVSHPLARTHPETGKTALYFNSGFLRHESLYDARTGEPLGEERSRRLVAKLLPQHNRPEYVCRFRWEEGSLAFWDNRAVQHYAASDYFPHRRVLRRVTVRGDKPFYDPEFVPNRTGA